jgi:hypothetical protein
MQICPISRELFHKSVLTSSRTPGQTHDRKNMILPAINVAYAHLKRGIGDYSLFSIVWIHQPFEVGQKCDFWPDFGPHI